MSSKEYDLICSLGGYCAAAHNLRFRNLRTFALPFDWTYFTDDNAIYILADNFENEFQNYMLKENLKELPKNSEHMDKVQHEDTYAHIIWANHFNKHIDDINSDYPIVKEKFNKRFKRLIDLTEKSKKILFLFFTNYMIKKNL